MKSPDDDIIAHMTQARLDIRLERFEIQVSAAEDKLVLSGQVLHPSDLKELRSRLASALPAAVIDTEQVRVLRRPGIPVFSVATNLTSLHRQPSFLSEQLSQLLNGAQLEVLFEEWQWCFVRQMDGYLGWAYRPYLSAAEITPPNHLVVAPLVQLWSEPRSDSTLVTRVLGGTALAVASEREEWCEVTLHPGLRGWVSRDALRSYRQLPQTAAQRRAQIQEDGLRMVGVPYLWGGCTANGIDCSGLAQLLHRWVGVVIPRDADMQCRAAAPLSRLETVALPLGPIPPESETPPLRPGDLLFFGDPGEPPKITHVAISLGGWMILHSSRSRNGVYAEDLRERESLRASFLSAASYLGEEPA